MANVNLAKRYHARYLAVQAIYQWQQAEHDLTELLNQFSTNSRFNKSDQQYFIDLVSGVVNQVNELDELFKPFLDRDIATLNPVELAVLRLSCYELKFQPQLPYRVVINEGLEMTKLFGATDGFKFVNAVLDKLARQLRSVEVENNDGKNS